MDTQINRRNLLKSLGLAGIGGIAGAAGLAGLPRAASAATVLPGVLSCTPDCVLMPSVTEGPYYFNANQFRSDITEGLPGVLTQLVIGVVDVDTCTPIANALVDVWQCGATGLYSGYNQPGGDTRGQDFFRGIQTTDANGQATFTTVYPGWYQGRTTHIHLKIRFNQTTYVTSQLFFPQEVSNLIYTTREPYSARGIGGTTNANDGIYQGTPNRERMLATVTPNGDNYTATIVVGVTGLTTAMETTPPTPQATLDAPFPNPTPSVATLWLTLPKASQRVRVGVYDVTGREVVVLQDGALLAGRHAVEFDGSNLPAGVYVVRADVGGNVLIETISVTR
ncbi:MAG TPA: T9SS type A sorting domain-containing protein [Rhodothermales bacterium]|nr:T9SS type A sorting domain-containing protein [Rhodothermales bacterium]